MKRTPIVLVGFIAILATLLLATFTSPFLIRLFVPTAPLTDSSLAIASPEFSDLQIVNIRLYDTNENGRIEGISVVFSLFVELPQLGVNAIEFNGELTLRSINSSTLETVIYSYPFPSSKVEFQDPGMNKFVTAELFFPFHSSPLLISDPTRILNSTVAFSYFTAMLTIYATFARPPQLIQLTILDYQSLQDHIGIIRIEMLEPVFSVKEISSEETDGSTFITFRGSVESSFSLSSLSAWLTPTYARYVSRVIPPNEGNVSNLLISQTNTNEDSNMAIPIQIQNSSFSVKIPLRKMPTTITYLLPYAPADRPIIFPIYAIAELIYSRKTLSLNLALPLWVSSGNLWSEIASKISPIREKAAKITLIPLDKDNNTIYEGIRIVAQVSNSTYPSIMLTVLGTTIPIVLPKIRTDQNTSIYSGEFPSSWFFSRISYGRSSGSVSAPFMVTQVATLYEDGTPAEIIETLPAFVLESWESTDVEILSINKPTFSPSLGFLEFSATATIYSSIATTLLAKVGPQTPQGRASSSVFPLRIIPIRLQPGVHDYPLQTIFPLLSSLPMESKDVSNQFHISFEVSSLVGVRSALPPISLGTVTVLAQSFRNTNDVYFNSLPSIGKSSSLEYQLTLYPTNLTLSFGLQVSSSPKDFISQKMTYFFDGKPLPVYHYLSTSKFLQLTFPEDTFNLFLSSKLISQLFKKTIDNSTILLSAYNILSPVLDIITPSVWNPFFLPDVDVSDIYLSDWFTPSFGVVVEKTTITLSDGSEHLVLRVDDTRGFTRYYDVTNRYLVKLVVGEYILELVRASISVGSFFSKDNGSQLLRLFLFSLIGLAILSWIIRDVRALLIQRKGKLLATEFIE